MRAAVVALAVGACSARRCDDRAPVMDSGLDAATTSVRDRCRDELLHAAVATPPGFGPLMDLVPACDERGSLVVWVVRGHTLARLSRPLAPRSTFGVPLVVATGASALGPTAIVGAHGPLAWRSPTLALDESEPGDEWWAARVVSMDGGLGVVRGSTLFPSGTHGEGILAPVFDGPRGIGVLGSVSREDTAPRLVVHEIPSPSDSVETVTEMPVALAAGELEAFESEHRVAVLGVSQPSGELLFRVVALDSTASHATLRGEIPIETGHALTVPRAVALGDASLFAFSEFRFVPPGTAGCLQIESLCVEPGAVNLARVDGHGVTTVSVAAHGMVDTLAVDAAGHAVLLYVAGVAGSHEERGASVDVAHGTVEALRIVPTDEIPPIDRPTLIECGHELWLVAEVLVGPAIDAGEAPETAVMAVPAECILSRAHDQR